MPHITPAELIADLKDVQVIHNKISRKLYRVHGKYSENQIKKHFGTFGAALNEAFPAPHQEVDSTETTESSELVGDTLNWNVPNTTINNVDQLIAHAQIDMTKWRVHRFAVNKKGQKGIDLFDVRATFIRNPDLDAVQLELLDLVSEARKEMPVPTFCNKGWTEPTGNVLEINIPDLHLGKLAYGKETGYQNYDSKIALDTFKKALDSLLGQVAHYKFDSILFILGNDLLNSDNAEGTTTSGTHVSNDGRYHKTFITARNMLKDAIIQLRTIAPVKVISCPGNHDRLASWHVADSLEMFFMNFEDVTFDNAPTTRKYFQHGKVLLMFCHGDQGKRTDYALTMATEQPRMWGETKYRECHTGHIHQTKVEEFRGVRVRILPALCPPDAWHSSNGFISNLRTAEAYVWNKDKGLVAQFYYNAD